MERPLTSFIRRNWRMSDDIADLRQEVYERALAGAQNQLPHNTSAYIYTVARNHLINRAKRAQIVSIDLVADLDRLDTAPDFFAPHRLLTARDELRWAEAGLERLPARCREVVRLRKVEGLSSKETAERIGVTVDTVEKQMVQGMRALVDYMLGGSGKIRRGAVKRPKVEYRP